MTVVRGIAAEAEQPRPKSDLLLALLDLLLLEVSQERGLLLLEPFRLDQTGQLLQFVRDLSQFRPQLPNRIPVPLPLALQLPQPRFPLRDVLPQRRDRSSQRRAVGVQLQVAIVHEVKIALGIRQALRQHVDPHVQRFRFRGYSVQGGGEVVQLVLHRHLPERRLVQFPQYILICHVVGVHVVVAVHGLGVVAGLVVVGVVCIIIVAVGKLWRDPRLLWLCLLLLLLLLLYAVN
mmetsp:Transcript_31694/g.67517  ORF Transcript_31694/g.67517 Transcript_31694/m.67517 type:complete len:234 (-) Transcript_31694:683-1384(-)